MKIYKEYIKEIQNEIDNLYSLKIEEILFRKVERKKERCNRLNKWNLYQNNV